ncbi:MAG: CoA pyrophosphatase [Sphingomonadales bacterium]
MRQLIEQKLGATAGTDGQILRGDFDVNPEARKVLPKLKALTPAAVLIPVIERPNGMTVLLTKRADHLNDHAGQVSFPGGRVEDCDASIVDTALRETEEEIGLARSYIDVVGQLEIYETVTGFGVIPVVGIVRPGFTLELDSFEVSEAFEVPLAFIFDPANHRRDSMVWKEVERYYYVFPYLDYHIWGATAGMLINFYRKVMG